MLRKHILTSTIKVRFHYLQLKVSDSVAKQKPENFREANGESSKLLHFVIKTQILKKNLKFKTIIPAIRLLQGLPLNYKSYLSRLREDFPKQSARSTMIVFFLTSV